MNQYGRMNQFLRRLAYPALAGLAVNWAACAGVSAPPQGPRPPQAPVSDRRSHVVIDSDANNELDDQHAIAYALLNRDIWQIEGVTTNRTKAGGGIEQHTAEARRVAALCGRADVPVLPGASGTFDEIKAKVQMRGFDGEAAVDFIIARAQARTPYDKLIVIPIGKLTNVALALHKQPAISPNVLRRVAGLVALNT